MRITNNCMIAKSKTNSDFTEFQLEVINEAIKELNHLHYRKGSNNDHYFFTKKEVDYVLERVPDTLVCYSVIFNDFGEIYCYKLSPLCCKEYRNFDSSKPRKPRKRKIKAEKEEINK